ncbi:MAG: carbohydrate ABC transporter permease [Treponema sp.]|jgi:multiple sugar transport system permease protein|nr:carbohydrate ABC transporter permease [Treponema sp.]
MTKQRKLIYALVYHVVVIGIGFAVIYPVLWMVMGSFKNNSQIINDASRLLPESFNLNNYITGWKGFGRITFTTFFRNSIFISVCSTFGVMISSALVAYSFARIRFKMRKILFACMISTMMLPGQVVMIPQYIIFQKLGFVNTYVPLILPAYFGSAFFIFMMMQFIAGIPKELDDAATIDGCSRYSIFTRIMLPLITPALITTVIISFYQSWDNFMGPLIYLSRPEKYPVALAIKMFADSSSVTDYGAMFAMSTLSLVPVFLIFLFFNRHIMEGISTQGLKM